MLDLGHVYPSTGYLGTATTTATEESDLSDPPQPRGKCATCGGALHRHGSKIVCDFDCYWHQFSRSKNLPDGEMVAQTPRMLREYADWLEGGNALKRPSRGHEKEPPDPRNRVYF